MKKYGPARGHHAVAQMRVKMKRPRISELDDEIARLEAELAAAESSSDSSSSDSEGSDGSDASASGVGNGAVIGSAWAESERIAPLPTHSLPAASCSVPVGQKRGAKRMRPSARTVPDWLDPSLYKPSQNRELYCRVCVFQASSVEELQEHRRDPAHIRKEAAEATHTFCKLCKKQFTSVAQLAEHKKGKWHLMREQRGGLRPQVDSGKGQGRGKGQGWGKGTAVGKGGAKGGGRGFGKGVGKGKGMMGKGVMGKGKGRGRGKGKGKGTWA